HGLGHHGLGQGEVARVVAGGGGRGAQTPGGGARGPGGGARPPPPPGRPPPRPLGPPGPPRRARGHAARATPPPHDGGRGLPGQSWANRSIRGRDEALLMMPPSWHGGRRAARGSRPRASLTNGSSDRTPECRSFFAAPRPSPTGTAAQVGADSSPRARGARRC